MKIKEIPKDLRPREKAIRYGIDSISDEELLALIIGSGVKGCSALEIARNLLDSYSSIFSISIANVSTLKDQLGLSNTLALRLLAAFELHNRLNSPMYQYTHTINCAKDVYLRYKYLENSIQEMVVVLMLDKKKRIIKEKTLYKGTNNNVSVSPKEIISEVILSRCQNFVLIHNHPNGDSSPSDEDIFVTEVIRKNLEGMDIKLCDHIIIYQGGYYSFFELENA